MNPVIKDQWVQALRSDEYEQGRDTLHRDGKFCCLGVLCDLAFKAGVTQRRLSEYPSEYRYGRFDGSEIEDRGDILPASVARWAGLNHPNPTVGVSEADLQLWGTGRQFRRVETIAHLSELNDSGKCTFSDIADIIEEQL